MQERAIPQHLLDIVSMFGSEHRLPSATAYFMRRKDIPPWLPIVQAKQIEGIVVIVSDNKIITAYRDASFLRTNKRRQDYCFHKQRKIADYCDVWSPLACTE
jgi:hypothetical protein